MHQTSHRDSMQCKKERKMEKLAELWKQIILSCGGKTYTNDVSSVRFYRNTEFTRDFLMFWANFEKQRFDTHPNKGYLTDNVLIHVCIVQISIRPFSIISTIFAKKILQFFANKNFRIIQIISIIITNYVTFIITLILLYFQTVCNCPSCANNNLKLPPILQNCRTNEQP